MSQLSDFIQYSILVACFSFTLVSQSLLLVKCMKVKYSKRLSPSILLNMLCWCWASISGILYMVYRGFFSPAQWNLNLMFFIVCIFLFGSCTVASSVTILLLDRILVLTYPTTYKKWQKWCVVSAFVFCIFIGSMSVIILCMTELPLNGVEGCANFGCVLSKNHGDFAALVRFSVNCLNLFIALVSQYVLCSFSAVTSSKRQYTRANRVTMFAFASEFILNFLPSAVHIICDIFKIPETVTLGPYIILMYGIDAVGTALIYRFVLTTKNESKAVIQPGQTIISKNQSIAPIRIE